jgi:hypothetical protein
MEIADGSRSPSVSESSSPKTRLTSNFGDVEAADVGDVLDLVATVEQGNDSYVTFKQAYALL